jgi:hypothetical protein
MKTNELLRYLSVYGFLAATWLPIMDYFKGSLGPTLAASFIVFVAADKAAHKIFHLP